MNYIPAIFKDLAGGINPNWSRIEPERPGREKLVKALCLRSLFRVSLVAIAVFATIKLSLTPFLGFILTAPLSVPATVLFLAVTSTETALVAAKAAFITKNTLLIRSLFGPIIVNSLAAKALISTAFGYFAYRFFHRVSFIKPTGILEASVSRALEKRYDLVRRQAPQPNS